jgi:hypothetical protein
MVMAQNKIAALHARDVKAAWRLTASQAIN